MPEAVDDAKAKERWRPWVQRFHRTGRGVQRKAAGLGLGLFIVRGLLRRTYEGPLDFSLRVKLQRPELASEIEQIVTLYSMLRYGCRYSAAEVSRLRHAVRAFRP